MLAGTAIGIRYQLTPLSKIFLEGRAGKSSLGADRNAICEIAARASLLESGISMLGAQQPTNRQRPTPCPISQALRP